MLDVQCAHSDEVEKSCDEIWNISPCPWLALLYSAWTVEIC